MKSTKNVGTAFLQEETDDVEMESAAATEIVTCDAQEMATGDAQEMETGDALETFL